jgi:hypothetical protein
MSDYKITIYTYGPQNPKDVGHAFIGLSSPGKAEVFVGFSPRTHVVYVKPFIGPIPEFSAKHPINQGDRLPDFIQAIKIKSG